MCLLSIRGPRTYLPIHQAQAPMPVQPHAKNIAAAGSISRRSISSISTPTNHVATSWRQVVPLPQHPQPPRVLQRGRRDAYIPPDSTAEPGISRIDQAKVPTRVNIRRYKSTHGGVYPMPEKARNVLGGQPRSCGGSNRPSDAC